LQDHLNQSRVKTQPPKLKAIQTANGKGQMANGLGFENRPIANHLNFAICRLPFEFALSECDEEASDPSPGPLRLMKTPAAVHPLPKGEGCVIPSLTSVSFWAL
jgi:hypothetical protein